jgi:hypothetical protein
MITEVLAQCAIELRRYVSGLNFQHDCTETIHDRIQLLIVEMDAISASPEMETLRGAIELDAREEALEQMAALDAMEEDRQQRTDPEYRATSGHPADDSDVQDRDEEESNER